MKLTDQNALTHIPKVDHILGWPEMQTMLSQHPRPEVLAAIRTVLDLLRKQVKEGGDASDCEPAKISARVVSELEFRARSSLRAVINGSGVVVHTNLGRSPLSQEALDAISRVAAGFSNLEYDLETGERGTRYTHVEGLICELTGCEAALVVNNNAAAVILALSALAHGREVIVSRGELVEIGGSFRIPDVMRQSGARLVEVGTTNRTYIRDFQTAITDQTALLLKVHTSNFAIVGFTADASLRELSELAAESVLPVMLDAGSGCLIDLSPYGIPGEPTIGQYLNAGCDVVTFSGDKLLGGPQAGLIAGKRQYIELMKRHPLLRALRIDKLNLAALEATLRLYRDERDALTAIPTLRMLTMTAGQLSRKADMLLRRLRRRLPATVTLVKAVGESSAGGGSFPLLQLPTILIEVRVDGFSAQQIDIALRSAAIPVIGRIHRGRMLLDVRTIMDCDLIPLANTLNEVFAKPAKERL